MTVSSENLERNEYNVYYIPFMKINELKAYLSKRYFKVIPLKKELLKPDDNFSYTLYFCDKKKEEGSAWITLLSSCSIHELTQEIRIYGAALVCENNASCFVISYGNAHFYISSYCDYNFGVSIAERLIDINSVKAHQNIAHGGKINRTYFDYFSGSTMFFRGGEIPAYIRGKSINKEEWGDIICCGTSVQFKLPEKPLEIGEKLRRIESVLKQKELNTIPRLIELNDGDSERIILLYKKLAIAINEYDESEKNNKFVNIPSLIIEGSTILQNDCLSIKLSCNYKSETYSDDLSIQIIKDFAFKKDIDLSSDLPKINIKIEYANGLWTTSKPLVKYIDFVSDDNFCLRNGRWFSFNNSYLARVFEDAHRIKFENHVDDIFAFNKESLIKFAEEVGVVSKSDKHNFETYYNELLARKLPATCVHPQTVPVDDEASGKYKYEICDLVQEDITMYFVKIGSPGDFAYAIDQALLTIDQVERNRGNITLLNGKTIHPQNISLLCILDDRRNQINRWEDIASVNFLVHLIEIQRRTNNLGINLKVDFVYNFQ